MNFIEFFDIKDKEHLKAYRHLYETGVWPEGFIPEGTEFDSGWQMAIQSKMATAYVNLLEKEDGSKYWILESELSSCPNCQNYVHVLGCDEKGKPHFFICFHCLYVAEVGVGIVGDGREDNEE